MSRILRIELAACYRIFDFMGWTELIYNHITLRIPGTEHLLINLYGMLYKEIAAQLFISAETVRTMFDQVIPADLRIDHREVDGVRREPFRSFFVGLTGVVCLLLTGLFFSAFTGGLVGVPLLVLVPLLRGPETRVIPALGLAFLKAAIALLWERRDQCAGAVPVLFAHDGLSGKALWNSGKAMTATASDLVTLAVLAAGSARERTRATV